MGRYLVTGASGFLGAHLVQSLQSAGHQIVALCRQPSPALEAQGVEVALGDILDAESVKAAAKGCAGMYHAAGMVSRDPEDTLAMAKINHQGTRIALKAAKEAGIPRVIHLSTSGTIALRERERPIPNEEAPTPRKLIGRFPYYRTKLYAEQDALALNSQGFEVISLNPSILFGPGDLRGSSTEDIRLFLEGKIPAAPPGGLSFVDVRDTAEACLLAMKHGKAGKRYLLGGANMLFSDFFSRLERVSGRKAPFLTMPKEKLLADISFGLFKRFQKAIGAPIHLDDQSVEMGHYFWYLDDSLARKEIGFTSREPMQTLYDTVQDLRQRGIVWPIDDEESGISESIDAWKDQTKAFGTKLLQQIQTKDKRS
jgi:dihydroflavonol-4-reductase